jgi:DNA-binding NtrC family response regulator
MDKRIMSNIYTADVSILIVDDKQRVRESLSLSLTERGFKIREASSLKDALHVINNKKINLALVDINLGEESGLDLLRQIQKLENPFPVIMFTGFGTIESAIESIKLGAFNYLQKPIKIEQLIVSITTALKLNFLELENQKLLDQISPGETLVTETSSMKDLCERAVKLAKTELPVMIHGESGTGKEMLADLIQNSSLKKDCPFIKVNCAAFPDSLLDDELFGHEKGAYTGASREFKGVFERAHKGTLFLDELGDMSISTQAKILRVLQNQEVKRIGGDKIIKVDVRFIAATNKNLDELMSKGLFREDLYYRLSTAIIHIPPLRERREDILSLTDHFLSVIKKKSLRNISISQEAKEFFLNYQWPGNVRELKSTLQYAAAISGSSVIGIEDLPRKLTLTGTAGLRGSLHKEMEAELILRILKENGNNKKRAAELLGISRATLYNKIKEYNFL